MDKAKATGGKVKVVAGTGSNNTAATVAATEKAKALGADAVLIVNPYYNKPSQKGLYLHIKAIDAVGIPIVLYNIPGRSSVAMTPQTIAQIYNDCNNVIAVKEATGSVSNAVEVKSLCDIQVLSGDDPLTLPLMSIGGAGVISVTSNFKPQIMKEICNHDNLVEGGKATVKYYQFIKSMFVEINPVPVKYAMYKCGMIKNPSVRQPLAELLPESQEKVVASLKKFNFLS